MQLVVPCTSSFPWARFVRAIAALISFQYVSSLLGPLLLAALHVCEREEKGSNRCSVHWRQHHSKAPMAKETCFAHLPPLFEPLSRVSAKRSTHSQVQFLVSGTSLKRFIVFLALLACVCERQTEMCAVAHWGQKRAADLHPRLELQAVVSPAVGAGNQMQVLWKSKDYSWTLSHPSSS